MTTIPHTPTRHPSRHFFICFSFACFAGLPGSISFDPKARGAYDRRMMAKQAARPVLTTAKPLEEKTISSNRQARYEYELMDRFEAGIVLTGSEIKSIRAGRVNLREAYVRVEHGEAWLVGAHISPYEQAGYTPQEPDRTRKLLLHNDEIVTLRVQTQTKGLTIVPLRLYLKGRRAKVEIAVGRGKKLYDKRATLAERDARRDIEQRRRDY